MFKNHTNCRVCGNEKLNLYLDLGAMPLSNNLQHHKDDVAPRYPLQVLLCDQCGLSQLSVVVDPQTLFGHYVYRSSISQGYKDHCAAMAETLRNKYGLNSSSFHIDIAGNDGALLAEFKKVLGHKCLNVDPAENLATHNEAQGVRYFQTFWGREAAQHLKNTDWPQADLITATNVFAHVDDVQEFLLAAAMVLSYDGVIVLEFPYLVDFIEKHEFDTVYFEHLSYFAITPLAYLCNSLGLVLTEVTHFDIHGGSVRCEIKLHGEKSQRVYRYMDSEYKGGYLNDLAVYTRWADNVGDIIKNFYYWVDSYTSRYKVYGFAASAKGNTLLNAAGITVKDMPFIVDETPEKIGKYSPGTGIPIISLDAMLKNPPDYLVLLSWNFADEIIHKCKAAGYGGKFIHPLTCEIII